MLTTAQRNAYHCSDVKYCMSNSHILLSLLHRVGKCRLKLDLCQPVVEVDLCQPVVLTGLNRFKPGKIEFMPASGINALNFSQFKPGGLNHLPTPLLQPFYPLRPGPKIIIPTSPILPDPPPPLPLTPSPHSPRRA